METKNVTERIKTFEDALKATNRPAVPEFLDVPEDMRQYFQAHYKIAVIAEALNEDWKADWNDGSQPKYYPWFYMSSSGFVFDDTDYYFSSPNAGCASRLCFKTRALAKYAGEQFLDIWEVLITK